MNLSNLQLDKQKKILVVIFCALIIYLDSAFILNNQISGIKRSNLKVARLKKDRVDLDRGLDSMSVSKNKQGAASQKVVTRSTKILAENQISGLLQEISSLANKLDIQIGQIRPSRETLNTNNAIAGDKFTTIFIDLDLTCDYHNLGKFVNALEGLQVFLSLQELKISTQLPDYMKQKVNLTLKTYVTK